jgi:exodeoxyribonuclease VII small subunit
MKADNAAAADEGPIGFSDAMAELTAIVTELESDALDVDQLAGRVERAAELVSLCRDRIDGARYAVDQIIGRLDQQVSNGSESAD